MKFRIKNKKNCNLELNRRSNTVSCFRLSVGYLLSSSSNFFFSSSIRVPNFLAPMTLALGFRPFIKAMKEGSSTVLSGRALLIITFIIRASTLLCSKWDSLEGALDDKKLSLDWRIAILFFLAAIDFAETATLSLACLRSFFFFL